MTSETATRTRAARLHLISRAELARHSAELLHSKEKALERERVRLEGHASRTKLQWEERCRDARTWLLRARMLGASGELATLMARSPEPAELDTRWQTSMGITHPGRVDCTPGSPPEVASTAALAPTIAGYRVALESAGRHAATSAALRLIDAELTNTRRRRRAIEERLIPRLETELHTLDLHLDEQDREEALRVHLATTHQESRRP